MFWSWFANTLQIVVLIHLVPKVLEPNNEYPYRPPSDWSCTIDASLKSSLRYDKYGREILELGSFHISEFGSLTAYTNEEDDIVRISALKSYCMMLCMILCVTLCMTWCIT